MVRRPDPLTWSSAHSRGQWSSDASFLTTSIRSAGTEALRAAEKKNVCVRFKTNIQPCQNLTVILFKRKIVSCSRNV